MRNNFHLCVFVICVWLIYIARCRRSMYDPIARNRQVVMESVYRLMCGLAGDAKYGRLVRLWTSNSIKVVHDDIETFTDNFQTIHMSFANRLELNAMMYVMVHELTHIHLQSSAHDTRFVSELDKLHTIAIELGLCDAVRKDDLYANKTIDSYE